MENTNRSNRWGCPPGWLCKPVQENCNFEAGIPAENFYCSPNECIPAEVIAAVLPTWDDTPFGNSTPLENPALQVNAIDSFFNMAPPDFGLTYEIFVVNEAFTVTQTIYHQPTQTVAARQAQTTIPGACYPWCNNCLLEAQSLGKTPALCQPNSAYEVSLGQCEQCISAHKSDSSGSFVEIAQQFQQFLDYCGQFSTIVATVSSTSTSTGPAGSTLTTVLSGTSSLAIPTGTSVSGTTLPITAPSSAPPSTSVPSTSAPSSTSAPASSPPSVTGSPYITTATVVIPEAGTTIAGTALAQVTVVLAVGTTQTSLSSSALSGATVIIQGSGTSTFVDTVTIQATAAAESASPSIVVAAAPNAAPSKTSSHSFMILLISGLVMIFSLIAESS